MKIEKILYELSKALVSSENGQNILNQYRDLQAHPSWKSYQGFLVEIANQLAGSMLTKDYTDLDKEQKDALQRAIYISKEVIDFLIDPTKGAIRYAAIKQYNQRLEATMRGSNRPKKKGSDL